MLERFRVHLVALEEAFGLTFWFDGSLRAGHHWNDTILDKINQADSMIFQTEKQLKEYGDKLSEGNKTAIQGALDKLKEVHKSGDLAAIDSAVSALNAAWQTASQEMYAASGAAGGAQAGANPGAGAANGPGSGGPGNGGGDATDVEYEEVKK